MSFSADFSRALDFEPWRHELVQRCLNNLHTFCGGILVSESEQPYILGNYSYICVAGARRSICNSHSYL